MQQRSGSTIKGVVTITLMVCNVIFWCTLLFAVALLKAIIPVGAWRRWTSRGMTALAEAWIGTNNAIFRLMGSLPLDTRGLEGLSTREWYLVISNHRSWVDILVLQAVFNRRIPFLKFFLKQQLIWVPFLGLAWWALDFPFMRRYTAAYLEKHPEHRGKDLEVTRRACEKFRLIPDLGDELRRGHAVHAGEARGVQVAVSQPAADAGGRHVVRALRRWAACCTRCWT